MTTKSLISISTIVIGTGAFLLSRVIWPDAPGAEAPAASLLPWFVVLGVIEALSFGLGVSLLFFYWQAVGKYRWAFFSVVWLLVSWWPHDNMHRIADEGNFVSLLLLEYGFHVTLMLAGFVLAHFIVTVITPRENVTESLR